MTLGEIIMKYRKDNDLTQREFAKKCGNITNGYISMIENEKNPKTSKKIIPSIEKLNAFAAGMGITTRQLVDMAEDMLIYSGNVGQSDPTADQGQLADVPYTEEAKKLVLSQNRVPDIDTAATKAVQTLLQANITAAPIDPIAILQAQPGVMVVTFTEMAGRTLDHMDSLVAMYGSESQDAITYSLGNGDNRRYIVAFNQRLPYSMIQMATARELGHIVLGHVSKGNNDVTTTEALYFARHLLLPRPLVHALLNTGIRLGVEAVGNLTGCYGRTLAGIRKTPGAVVPGHLNAEFRQRLSNYIESVVEFKSILAKDDSMIAKFGIYMDNYEE